MLFFSFSGHLYIFFGEELCRATSLKSRMKKQGCEKVNNMGPLTRSGTQHFSHRVKLHLLSSGTPAGIKACRGLSHADVFEGGQTSDG